MTSITPKSVRGINFVIISASTVVRNAGWPRMYLCLGALPAEPQAQIEIGASTQRSDASPAIVLLALVSGSVSMTHARHHIVRFGCDSDTDANRAMPTAHETSKTQTLRNKGPFFPHFSLLVVKNWSWKCLNKGNFTLRFVWKRNAAIRVPKEHYWDAWCRGESSAARHR